MRHLHPAPPLPSSTIEIRKLKYHLSLSLAVRESAQKDVGQSSWVNLWKHFFKRQTYLPCPSCILPAWNMDVKPGAAAPILQPQG